MTVVERLFYELDSVY